MSPLRRHRWFIAAAGITLAFAVVCLASPKSASLNVFSDVYGLILMLAGFSVALANARTQPGKQRSFWFLMAAGILLWACNQAAWVVLEGFQHRQVPDPFLFDIILFFHAVPIFAAVAWRPDQLSKEGKVLQGVLNLLMLTGWWIFLYAFIVFPHQYVSHNLDKYNTYYDRLYGLENGLLATVLVLAVCTSSGGWRRLYAHLLAAVTVYSINSQLLDRATADSTYYSGSLYDVPLVATIAWIAATALSAREWDLKSVPFNLHRRWKKLIPRLAMLAILSLPVLGLWAALLDASTPAVRFFRIFTVLTAMLVLGAFVFLRQFFQDQALISLLKESRRAYESQKRLQTQLVQKEKLASLGNLVAGAAHEINHPLNAIMTFSEELWTHERLTEDQNTLLRKIVNQARRTGDLVANLLSFAQQAPGQKTLVDLGLLLQRASHMLESRRQSGLIQVQLSVDSDFPKVVANANQLFQAFVEIIENSMDALDEVGGGSLEISAQKRGAEVVLNFADSGPGLRDPQRVFDPFYTTKPIGKGTGLGLSAVYGVIQDHNGQITCQNKPEGGALFTIRLPATSASAAEVAGAAGA